MEYLLAAVEAAIQHEADNFTDHNWNLERVYGGMNSITYRANNAAPPQDAVMVKIRKRDERRRAWREFSAMQALASLNRPVAPQPFVLKTDSDTLPGDVVISSWVAGEVLGDLTATSLAEWNLILTTLANIHSVQPTDAPHLADAVLPVRSTQDVITEIERRYALLPDGQIGETTKTEIGQLFEEFRAKNGVHTQPAQIGLILCDSNPANMIYTQANIIIVDWENSGWGDPAYDIADLLVRPECADLTPATRTWLLHRYGELLGLPDMGERILAYEKLMLIFWLILTSNGFSNYKPQRLPGVRSLTLEQTRQQQIRYLQRIEKARRD